MTAASAAERTVSDYYRPEMWVRRIVVAPENFSLDQLEWRFRQFLMQSQEAARVVQLQVYVDQRHVFANCQCMTDMTYRMWRMLFDDYRDHIAPVAELTIIGRSASMRVRGVAGGVHSKVLQGDDPLRVVTGRCTAEVLHIHPDVFRRLGQPRLDIQPDLTFYLRAEQPLTRACGESVARLLRSKVKVDRIQINMRLDTWFIADGLFPIVYPFQETLDPPTVEAYEKNAQIDCLAKSDSDAVRCWGGEAQK